jgi:hypothetical protein
MSDIISLIYPQGSYELYPVQTVRTQKRLAGTGLGNKRPRLADRRPVHSAVALIPFPTPH